MLHRFSRLPARAWQIDRPLTVSTALMLAACAAAAVGLWLDPRTIGGAPAWLKPAKFGISTALYGGTLIWVFSALPEWIRLRRFVGWFTAVVFVLEIAIIDLQAWRGTTSHFNVSTPLDATLFAIMGTSIVAQTVTVVGVAVALWRQRFTDAALGWALRLGMIMTVVGASTGGLMTRPTPPQMEQMALERRVAVIGAHTVGAPDGGPGIPGTGWSLDHGDLRVPHFVGLHAIQALALALLAIPRRLPPRRRARAVMIAGASYFGLFTLLLWQALRGEPVLQPSALTAAMFAAWILASLVALAAVVLPRTASPMQNGALHSA